MKILLVGTSDDIQNFDKEYFQTKREEGYTICSYSNALDRFLEIDFIPDYWTFFDPFTVKYYNLGEDFFKYINLLIPNIFDNGLENFFKLGFKGGNINRTPGLLHMLQNINIGEHFKTYTKVPNKGIPSSVNYTKVYDSTEYKLPTSTDKNFCKFSYFYLPFIIEYFDNIQEIKVLGFGHYELPRFGGGKSTRGYPEFVDSYHLVESKLISFLSEKKVKIRFEGKKSLYNKLEWDNQS